MVADALKSASITNLDADPIVRNTSGVGAGGRLVKQSDSVTPSAAGLVDTSSKYKMVRVPTNIYLQHVNIYADAALDTGAGSAALVVDVGVYYSDGTKDGTPAVLQGTAVSATALVSSYALKGNTSAIAAEAGTLTAAKRQQPLWQAAGLSSDPGGQFDIVLAVHTAANTASSKPVVVEIEFIKP